MQDHQRQNTRDNIDRKPWDYLPLWRMEGDQSCEIYVLKPKASNCVYPVL